MRNCMYYGKLRSDIGFYIGDICYALSDKMYHEIWGDKYRWEDGEFEMMDSGFNFAVGSTAYGDGCYTDQYGHEYPVDAGVIGIVPLELVAKEEAYELGFVSKKPGIATYCFKNGTFRFDIPNEHSDIFANCIYIDTNEIEDEEMEEDEDE